MWVQGIERKNRVLTAMVIDDEQNVEWRNLNSTWEGDIPISRASKMAGTTCFSRWKLVDASEYLAEMGIDIRTFENKHAVYEVDLNGLTLIVPAILVIKALFKPHVYVFEYLFRPAGIDMLLAPRESNGSTSIAFLPQRKLKFEQIGDTTLERLQWLYCFPSARAAFDSVYKNAAAGWLAVSLPKAEVDMSLRGRLLGNRFFASILNFSACTPLEAPFDWAGRQPETFRLRSAPAVEQLNPVLTNADIGEGVDGWKLSEFEWTSVEHLFPAGSRLTSGSRAREFVDAILAKLGTGVGWAGVNSKFGTTSAVSSFYQNCRKSGRWDKVLAILMEIRKHPVTLAPAA